MSLSVGTNSYISVSDADAYHAERGNSSWPTAADSTASKEAALIKATSFIDVVGYGNWKGRRATQEQPLAWPRKYVIDGDGYEIDSATIPTALKSAVAEAALKIIQGTDLMPDETENVASESVAGAVSISYFEGKSGMPVYKQIYGLLDSLLAVSIGSSTKITFSTKGYEPF